VQLNRTFLETGDLHPLFVQQDANTDITGDWMSMVNYNRAYVLLHKAGSEQVDTLGLQILQASDNAGTGAKGVSVSRCWYKTGTMTAQGLWTNTNFSTPADFLGFGSALSGGVSYATTSNQRVVADVSTNPLSLLVEIMSTDLDQANGFKYVTAFLEGDNVDNSCLITAFWLGWQPSFASAIPLDPTL
jgi:hypothetical protein